MTKLTSLSLGLVGFALSACPAFAQPSGNPGFDRMKTLVGEWSGQTANGKAVQVSYRLVSSGTALLETLEPADEPEMVTLYTADSARVAVTHYCSAHNQPRLRTAPVSAGPEKLDVSFVGASNLASPAVGHMHGLVVAFQDNDHFSQSWTWREKGKDQTETFHFTRKK